MQAGVPQGSRLGTFLFMINMNDIIDDIKSDILKFADGTSFMASASYPAETAAQRFGKNCVMGKQMEGYI